MAIITEQGKREVGRIESYIAGEDLSSSQYYLVKLDSTASGKPEVSLAGAGERVEGILQNAPESGELADVLVEGDGQAVAAGTFNGGLELASDANGKLVTASAGDYVIGTGREPSQAADHLVSVSINKYVLES